MKPILILQHVWEDPQGLIGTLLQEYQLPTHLVNVDSDPIPDPTAYGAIIVLGGSQHVYEEEQHPYFTQERRLIQAVIAQDIPYLGICLGGQLLADVLGGKVHKHSTSEIGFYNVQLTAEGQRDPLYTGLRGYHKVFHWHEDTFHLPSGAILLATERGTPHQAFRYGSRAYGLQYHIELNEEILDLWLHHPEFKADIIATLGQDAYNTIEQSSHSEFLTYREHTRIVLRNFLTLSSLI